MSSSSNGHKIGRPSIKTPELLDSICKRVRLGATLRSLSKEDEMPHLDTILTWRNDDPTFSEQLERAREVQADVWADDILAISDEVKETSEAVQKARLRTQVRQFLMSKHSKRYADSSGKTEVNVSTAVVLLDPQKQQELQERRKEAELTLKDKV